MKESTTALGIASLYAPTDPSHATMLCERGQLVMGQPKAVVDME